MKRFLIARAKHAAQDEESEVEEEDEEEDEEEEEEAEEGTPPASPAASYEEDSILAGILGSDDEVLGSVDDEEKD